MKRSFGPGSLIRKINISAIVELRDLESMTILNEIVNAIFRETDVGSMGSKVLSIRETYKGAQTVIALLPMQEAKTFNQAGRIRVGVVYARVRPAEVKTRC